MNTKELPDDFDIDYPKRGDKLIAPGDKTLFADWMAGQWHWYPDAYKKAADKLVGQIEGHAFEDVLIFPVIFLYRHFVELKLKELIKELDNLSGTRISDSDFKTHRLGPLWNYVKAHLGCIRDGNWDNDILPALENLVKELAQLDPDSYHFRYSHNTQLKEIPLPHAISLAHFKEAMTRIANGFAYIDVGIEMEREGRSLEADFNSHYF